jgi:hypothetical protein
MTFVSKLFFDNKVESIMGKSQPKSGKYWQHMSVMIENFVLKNHRDFSNSAAI